jgi:NTE family protein
VRAHDAVDHEADHGDEGRRLTLGQMKEGMAMGAKRKVALVVSGGGAKGAFAVGVLRHLFAAYRETGWFSITGGTSTGALISPLAALMAGPDAMATEALEVLVDTYSNSATPQILARRHLIAWLWRQDCVYTTRPLRDLIDSRLKPEWFEWLRGDEAPDCYVVYVDYGTGSAQTASPREEGMTRERFVDCMLASASVPVVMNAAQVDGRPCYDGGVRDLLPLGTAINMGAEVLFPIFLDPEQFPPTTRKPDRVDRIMMRTLDIMMQESLENDVSIAHMVNIAVKAREELERQFPADSGAGRKVRHILGREEYADLFGRERRVVEIIGGLRPDEPLTDNSLDFKPNQMRSWIAAGEAKAGAVLSASPF